MSRLTRISLLLAIFFGLDKVLGILRQVIIGRQFGLSAELDTFNVANNLPDLLYAMVSGGALALAFIPILSEVLTLEGRQAAWKLFSRIANLAFLVTASLAILIGILARALVGWQYGIAPGFPAAQQLTVISLMRLDLIATLIFSISGLVMSGLQANQHFFLPALAPLFYNLGQIFGATVLAPAKGYVIGGIQLPAYGMGIYGLVYGVILGAILHLSIQIPGLIKYHFHWSISLGLKDTAVRKVLTLMLPRLATIFVSQLIFLIRDNLASRLAEGSVTALTYGWMIMQVPETLIGTAIGTALLPTLSEFVAREDREAFKGTIQRAIRVLVALTIPVAVLLSLGLHPLTRLAFGFDPQKNELLIWVTRGYLIGLTGQCLLEVLARAFYSRQEPRLPLLAAVLNLMIYAGLGSLLYRPLGAPGISLTDSIAYTFQSLFLLVMLNRRLVERLDFSNTLIRALLAAAAGGLVAILFLQYTTEGVMAALISSTGMLLGAVVALPLLWREIRILIKL